MASVMSHNREFCHLHGHLVTVNAVETGVGHESAGKDLLVVVLDRQRDGSSACQWDRIAGATPFDYPGFEHAGRR